MSKLIRKVQYCTECSNSKYPDLSKSYCPNCRDLPDIFVDEDVDDWEDDEEIEGVL